MSGDGGSSQEPFVESVFHPSDFSEASEVAFAHALAIALVRRAAFAILHAGERTQENWARFPAVRRTLERWKLLEPGSPRRAVFEELEVGVTKIHAKGNPVRACVEHIEKSQPDLVVLATGGREGPARWLQPSVAQRIARRSRAMTLFVPEGCRPLVDLEDGHLHLRRILLPVAERPDPARATLYAARAAEALGDPPVEIMRLHVGRSAPPGGALPEGEAWRFEERLREGDVVDEILSAARRADLVVMPTDGRDGFLDVFRGSHTERVVREVDCPLLAVPGA